MNNFHTPVLLQEVLTGLQITPGKNYIDATIGGGGHSFEILKSRSFGRFVRLGALKKIAFNNILKGY